MKNAAAKLKPEVESETVKTTTRIKRSIWIAARKRALDEDLEFQELVECALLHIEKCESFASVVKAYKKGA